MPEIVYSILKEARKPMTANQIYPLLLERGKNVKKIVMTTSLYRDIKRGVLFKKVKVGTFGLLEWFENKNSSYS